MATKIPCPTEAMIKEAVDEFDAEKVYRMMNVVGWRWVTIRDRAPSPFEIRAMADKCCRQLNDRKTMVGGGGICAEWHPDDSGVGHVEIFFDAVRSYGFDEERSHPQPPETPAPPRTPEKNGRS